MATEAKTQRVVHVLASACLGLLVGALLGLAVQAAVGSALSALLALLGGFFGLRESGNASRLHALKIAAFSLSCLLAVLAAVYVRTHDLLSPDYQAELGKLRRSGVLSPSEVRAILIYERFGVVTTGFTVPANPTTKDATVLFSEPVVSQCSNLSPSLFQDAESRIAAMRFIGGPWAQLAEKAAASTSDQKRVLDEGYRRICDQ